MGASPVCAPPPFRLDFWCPLIGWQGPWWGEPSPASRCGRGQEVWKTGKNGSPRPTMRLAREYASVDLVRPVHKPEMRPGG